MTTLVLLHAFPLDSAMYDKIRGPLADSCDLLTPDFPGFGGGPLPDGEPSLDRFADAVLAELDARGLDQVVLGGTSMGGYTAMAVLRKAPERVRGLVLLDTKASSDTPEAADGRRAMADQLEREGNTHPLLESVYPKLLGTTTMQQRREVADRVMTWVAEVSPVSAAWAQRAMANRPDSFEILRAVDVPTVVIVGEEDVLSPPTDAAAMVSAIPQASLAMVPEAGHLTPVESPEVIADVVRGFLTRLG